MTDAKALTPTFETVKVLPDCSVTVTVEAAHSTFQGHAFYPGKVFVATSGQTIDVSTAAAGELRAAGYVV